MATRPENAADKSCNCTAMEPSGMTFPIGAVGQRTRPLAMWAGSARKERPAPRAGPVLVAGGSSHHPAGKAELALTWRTMALVVAPQEHPFEIGLGSKREAGPWAQRTWRHATPVTEALHVPLHLERSCYVERAHAVPRRKRIASPGRKAQGAQGKQLCSVGHSGSGGDRDKSAAT